MIMLLSNFIAILHLLSIGTIIFALYSLPGKVTRKTAALWMVAGFALLLISYPSSQNIGFTLLALCLGIAGGYFSHYHANNQFHFSYYGFFQSFLGLALLIVSVSAFYFPESFVIGRYGELLQTSLFMLALSGLFGALTTGAMVIAFCKHEKWINADYLHFENQNFIHAILFFLLLLPLIWMVFAYSAFAFWLLLLLGFVLGASIAIKIHLNDNHLFIKAANIFLGAGIAFSGFALNMQILIIAGTLVAVMGYRLAVDQCRLHSRSLMAVMIGDDKEVIFDYTADDELEDDIIIGEVEKDK